MVHEWFTSMLGWWLIFIPALNSQQFILPTTTMIYTWNQKCFPTTMDLPMMIRSTVASVKERYQLWRLSSSPPQWNCPAISGSWRSQGVPWSLGELIIRRPQRPAGWNWSECTPGNTPSVARRTSEWTPDHLARRCPEGFGWEPWNHVW